MNDALGSPQSVLVLGGTSDIARCLLRVLVSRRTRTVVLAGRDPARLKEAADELQSLGADRVETLPFEATDTAGHQALVDDVFARHGEIDLVLFAFGTLGRSGSGAGEAAAGEAAEVAAVNYLGAVSAGTAVATHLRRQGHGTLVALSSVAGVRVRRANFVYGSSKAGMDAFFQGLGDSLAGSGARVVVVRPGFVRTRMTAGLRPAPFATGPEEVASGIVRALETGADTVWVPPVLRWIMLGVRLLPRAVFRRLPL
ncbi:MAG TPA: decaprenylphospho-beta-D-erythro-pentofuranosid-2-ulose 2-reductase [Actinomycetota bacterium]|nr:decaprenylphospho-beta-D-erythro-pentofuranosid-2-ulose 2-reductase [Actinomycetota bacterium]